jgi:hypothetical protein
VDRLDATTNGRLKWQWLLEWVIVPTLGVAIIVVALSGVTVPAWLVPLVPGLLVFPFARMLDRLRQSDK